MTPPSIVVYGAGGHGKVVADIALSLKLDVTAFVDDGIAPGVVVLSGSHMTLRVSGDMNWIVAHRDASQVAFGLGNNEIRKRVWQRLIEANIETAMLAHPTAVVSRFAQVGSGTVIMPLAVVNTEARIGIGCIINTGAVVEHGVRIGDFAHVSPNATLAGEAQLGESSHLGTGAIVLPGIVVGRRCIVGAGAVVNKDVPDGTVVAGVPARRLRDNAC